MLDVFLVPGNTTVTAKGDSNPVELTSGGNATYLLTLSVMKIVEQEAIDVSVFTSADGTTWGPKPVASLPQKFYPGEYPLLVDLSTQPHARFLRAHWEVNRWGRGSTTPTFEIGIRLREIPQEALTEATAEARARK